MTECGLSVAYCGHLCIPVAIALAPRGLVSWCLSLALPLLSPLGGDLCVRVSEFALTEARSLGLTVPPSIGDLRMRVTEFSPAGTFVSGRLKFGLCRCSLPWGHVYPGDWHWPYRRSATRGLVYPGDLGGLVYPGDQVLGDLCMRVTGCLALSLLSPAGTCVSGWLEFGLAEALSLGDLCIWVTEFGLTVPPSLGDLCMQVTEFSLAVALSRRDLRILMTQVLPCRCSLHRGLVYPGDWLWPYRGSLPRGLVYPRDWVWPYGGSHFLGTCVSGWPSFALPFKFSLAVAVMTQVGICCCSHLCIRVTEFGLSVAFSLGDSRAEMGGHAGFYLINFPYVK